MLSLQNSYDGGAVLYIVPTPIGNMEDITLRALSILKEVKVIFSEDTRETLNLMRFFNIENKVISSHQHNEQDNVAKMLDYLVNGHNVAIVSDRGTPLISDPGHILVKEAITNNYNVVSLPGATALIPALTMSSLDSSKFYFIGFLSTKLGTLKQQLEDYSLFPETMIFYESPKRIIKTLELMLVYFGDREVSVIREISKKFEQVIRGTITEVLNAEFNLKGEFVLVVSGQASNQMLDYDKLLLEVERYNSLGMSVKNSINEVANLSGASKNKLYELYHKEV